MSRINERKLIETGSKPIMLSSRFPRCSLSTQKNAPRSESDIDEPHRNQPNKATAHSNNPERSENPYAPPLVLPQRSDRAWKILGWYVIRGAVVGAIVSFTVGSIVLPLISWLGWTFGDFYVVIAERKVPLSGPYAVLGLAVFGAFVGLLDWSMNARVADESQ